MPDEPIVAPAAAAPEPAPAPAAEPAAAPAAEPAAAPAAEPAAEPADAPAAKTGYPEGEAPPKLESVARSTYQGQSFDMTQAQLDELIHHGLSAIEAQQAGAKAQPAAAAPAAAPEEPDAVALLKSEMASLKQTIQAQSYESRVQNETTRINQSLDSELTKHEVFKDNPSIAEIGRKSALALLNHNPRMTESDAMKSVANDFGKALNAKKEQWIKGKVADAASAEAGPGGAVAGSPGPKKLTGNDLMRGKVMAEAMKRTAGKNIIT